MYTTQFERILGILGVLRRKSTFAADISNRTGIYSQTTVNELNMLAAHGAVERILVKTRNGFKITKKGIKLLNDMRQMKKLADKHPILNQL